MIPGARISLLAAILVAALGAPALAQDDEPPVGPGRVIELEVHGGGIRFEEGGSRPAYGGRLGLRFPNGIGIGANATLAERNYDDVLTGSESEKADAQYYTLDLSYMLKSVEPANIYALLGAGVARYDPPPAHEAVGIEKSTEVLIQVGVGILWYAHGGSPWWALRTEIRDNIVFLNGIEELETDDSIMSDWEIAIGLSLLFGSYD
jgi:opacity protein-like surface antigen